MTKFKSVIIDSPNRTCSEPASKEIVRAYGIRVPIEHLADDPDSAATAAEKIGFPVVLKLAGEGIAHKTERNLVRLAVADADAVRIQTAALLALARPEDGDVSILVAEQIRGQRELIAGFVRDPQFGPCVLLGLGGILAEAIGDAVFAVAPLDRREALAMLDGLATSALLTEPHRGEPAIDREALADILEGLSRLALEHPEIESVDLNPLIVAGDQPIAVDALVVLGPTEGTPDSLLDPLPDPLSDEAVLARFRPLFHPRGIIVAGVSSHPGKFGFVTFHNLLRCEFSGDVFGVKPDAAEVLGEATYASVESLPSDAKTDLVFLATPNQANVALLRACAKRGVRAAFVASAGYAEAGDVGRALQEELVSVAEELDILLIGPNGQGVVSTP
ncbi:MAG: acetate--CoA ligase family protein, partial [Myxococcota bacterium]